MYVVRLKPALLEIRSMGSTKRTFLRPQGWKDPKKKAARIGNRLARRLCYLPGSKIVMVLIAVAIQANQRVLVGFLCM